jgi:hypothetical protein
MATRKSASNRNEETEAEKYRRLLAKAGIVVPAPAPQPQPLVPRSPDVGLERFGLVWASACRALLGHEKYLLPWKQFTFRSSEVGVHSYEFWAPKTDVVADLVDPQLSSKEKCDIAWRFNVDPGWGRKGINATANCLWQARGDCTKEGLVLCHAFLRQVCGSRRGSPSPLESFIGRIRLPALHEVNITESWHRSSVQLFPEIGVFDSYAQICSRAKFVEASDIEREMSVYDLSQIVLTEFLLSSRNYDLVSVDVVGGPYRHPRQPIYEHAEQHGDKVDLDPNPSQHDD